MYMIADAVAAVPSAIMAIIANKVIDLIKPASDPLIWKDFELIAIIFDILL